MKNPRLFFALSLLTVTLLSGCGDDDQPSIEESSGILVVNEGNFRAGDGSLSTYDADSEEAAQGAYLTLGTTQSVRLRDNMLYVCSNDADKLEILDAETLEITATITEDLIDPINFDVIDNTGFVSCWGDPDMNFAYPEAYVALIDLNDNSVSETIELGARVQDVLAVNDLIFVAVTGSNFIAVLNKDGEIVEEIETPFGPSALIRDNNDRIWTLTNTGSLTEINTSTLTLTGRSIENLTVNAFREKMAYDPLNNLIYFLGGNNAGFTGLTNVFKVDLAAEELSAEPFIQNGAALYGIAVNPSNGDVYVGDSNAFQSTGTGFRYNSEGELLDQFPTGIGPNNFVFR